MAGLVNAISNLNIFIEIKKEVVTKNFFAIKSRRNEQQNYWLCAFVALPCRQAG